MTENQLLGSPSVFILLVDNNINVYENKPVRRPPPPTEATIQSGLRLAPICFFIS